MRILISVAVIISDHKIKIKTDEALIKALIETYKIFNESYMTFNNFSDKTEVDQNLIFLSVNMIITEKIIFVINVIF